MLYVVVLCGCGGGGLVVKSVEEAQSIMIVWRFRRGREGTVYRFLTIGRKPYNDMQRAYGSPRHVHMGLDLVLCEDLFFGNFAVVCDAG